MADLEFIGALTQRTGSKIVLLVLDGLGGLPRGVGGPTELEAASTPNMDKLAREGSLGLMRLVGQGISPGSGPGHLGLFGYDPRRYVIGRGVLESVGIGVEITERDVAARGNFCTVDEQGRITDRRAGRIPTEECARLVAMIEDISLPGIEVIVKPVRDYRFALILRGDGLSPRLNETDPQQVGAIPLTVEAQDGSQEALNTAELANQWIGKARERIKGQKPANMVLLRGWSREPGLPRFEDVFKLKAVALAVYPMYKGLASLVGMKLIHGLTNLEDQLLALRDNWNEHDFFFVHHKYTDSRGEDGDFDAKVKEIEKVDRIVPRILDLGPKVLAITGDHSTPSVMKSHTWHPTPVLLWAPGTTRRNWDVSEFGETECLKGALGQFDAADLMILVTAHAGKQIKFGA
ncbi:MAG: 2,3-bisphosphoglycerate-independent phosphoglycerate mutase [Deltaproteobacteria bacterium]|nr:2,3-bisphosphoglycerate-independent phosphoglycerate mutase [Deltaproteobacteria bacterium]